MKVTNEQEREKIPLFPSWKGWYYFILAVLALQIVMFFWLTKHFE